MTTRCLMKKFHHLKLKFWFFLFYDKTLLLRVGENVCEFFFVKIFCVHGTLKWRNFRTLRKIN